MKRIISIIVTCYLFLTIQAENISKPKTTKLPLKLSKQQMHEDFDQFLQIIKTYNAQWEIRKQHTGYDMLAKLEEQRPLIDKMKNYWLFIDFMNDNLKYIMDVHAAMRPRYYQVPHPRYAPGQSFYDSLYVKPVWDGTDLYFYKYLNTKKNKFPLQYNVGIYIEGHYYMPGYWLFVDSRTGDSLSFQRARIIAYNHQPVDIYVKNKIGKMSPYSVRWDFHRQKYYTDRLYIDFAKVLKIEDDSGKIIEFIPDRYNSSLSASSYPEIRNDPEYYAKWKPRPPQYVTYISEYKLLYIYTRWMYWREEYNLMDSIKAIGKDKVIDRVVIDVRGCEGGGDEFWQDILSAIVNDTVFYQMKLAMNNNDEVKAYFNAEFPPEMTNGYAPEPVLALDNKIMYVTKDMRIGILPDSNSLNFAGKIYVLQDDDTYSSGHSFTSVARQISQLVSMGMPTGNMAGFGLNPWGFQLNHSKFTFQFEPAIDISCAKTWEDIFQDIPEIEVIPTLKELLDYLNFGTRIDPSTNLPMFDRDYLFKKMLSIE
jgi:hypothetical protein